MGAAMTMREHGVIPSGLPKIGTGTRSASKSSENFSGPLDRTRLVIFCRNRVINRPDDQSTGHFECIVHVIIIVFTRRSHVFAPLDVPTEKKNAKGCKIVTKMTSSFYMSRCKVITCPGVVTRKLVRHVLRGTRTSLASCLSHRVDQVECVEHHFGCVELASA